MPDYYLDHFKRLLFRLNLCIRLWEENHGKKGKKVKGQLRSLVYIMCHLDNVVESTLRPSLEVSMDDIERWRCLNFEEYLVTEFLLGRHDPTTVHNFRSLTSRNIERIDLQGLGEYA